MSERRSHFEQRHMLRGVRTSTATNASAYGFSLASTGSFAALDKLHHAPSWAELFAFLAAACACFALVNALSTWFFRKASPEEPELVISLATSLSVFSVCASVGSGVGVAALVPGWAAWLVTAFVFPIVYIAGLGAEIGVAAYHHPHGGVEGERARRRSRRRGARRPPH